MVKEACELFPLAVRMLGERGWPEIDARDCKLRDRFLDRDA
jgi:hypothetical protein